MPVTITSGPTASRAPYQARPGRQVLVIDDLADLRGPSDGEMVLPLRLYWSPAGRRFDLADPYVLRSMYQIVLGQAIDAADLASYINADHLLAIWPELHLPKGVRRAWEERHPRLRVTVAAA